MEGITPETVLEKMCRGHLDCSICLERFKDPKLLKCRHNFCKTCLEDMIKAQPRHRQNVICCPVCREDTVIPKAGIAGLDDNFTLMAIVDEANHQEMLLKLQKSRIACESCVEKNQAIVKCVDCREFLCQECHTTHKRMKKTITHEVVKIDDLRTGKVTYEGRYWKEIPECEKHDRQSLIFYCTTCNALICTVCAAVVHRSHEVQDTLGASAECQKQISHLLKKVEEKLKKFEAAKGTALKSYKKHEMMVLYNQGLITRKANEAVAKIREKERRHNDQLLKISTEKEKQFKDLLMLLDKKNTQTKDTLDRVRNSTLTVIPLDLLKMKDSILRGLKVEEERSIPDPVHCMTGEDFKQIEIQANLEVLNAAKQRPPISPRPEKFNREKKMQKKVRTQVTEDEAAITPVEVRDQVTEDEAAITRVQARTQVPEDEAAITRVQVRTQVTEDEAAITRVQARDQVPEDEAAITRVQVRDQVTEDEAVITPVEPDDMYMPHKKVDKTKWRRIIGPPRIY